MPFCLLPALEPHEHFAMICVKVARKWEYRGPADDGQVMHIDLVIADQEGNAMYAEIPHDVIDNFDAQIQEGEIYVISRFRVTNAKNYFRAVEGRYMIEFTYHTRVAVARDPPIGFPKYVYNLTPFHHLPDLVGDSSRFLGQDYISGSSASKWLFAYTTLFRLRNERISVNHLQPPLHRLPQAQSMVRQENRYLADLQRIDPYGFPPNGCLCTVTIARLVADVPWWFPSCTKCYKACTPEGNTFRCYRCNYSNYRYNEPKDTTPSETARKRLTYDDKSDDDVAVYLPSMLL
ncbi:hypothetical protein C2845_PM05G33090 [Panicum miliaceum]|uniref:Replication protein A 70 kDa DNA-binding subunit B/D first OB fold domain-containing protein n=1 Tax=Panicum miliaceum TaxID=4540 RepID=A0A3L6T0U1_PANMI|nr:hypothetical protein C2845_PM05G33090 [Panicum miliaceum]